MNCGTQRGADCKSALQERGFTMVEIALSLAVVAFALVAIMGVLPTGMTVEKDNREDTLMNQEGRFWLEAIKTGARGLDEITNYVEYIRIDEAQGTTNTLEFSNKPGSFLMPMDIMALLSRQKYIGPTTNRIIARIRPITGAAVDRMPMRGKEPSDASPFRYQMLVEITPAYPMPIPFVQEIAKTGNLLTPSYNEQIGTNLWDVRLVMRWPLVERGNDYFVGNGRKTLRARISAQRRPETNITQFVKDKIGNALVLTPN